MAQLWKYISSRSTELVKQFADEPFAVSLHSGGLAALVAFSDKLCLLTILLDDVRQDPLMALQA